MVSLTGDGRKEAFSPAVNPRLHPAVLYKLIFQAEPSHQWQIWGTGLRGISDLIRYDKPLCSLANLVKRLSLKKKCNKYGY